MGGGGGGAGGGLITDANARLLVEDDVAALEDATEVRELPLFDFDEPVDMPTIADGDPVPGAWSLHQLWWGRGYAVYSPSPPPAPGDSDFVSEGPEEGPTLLAPGSAADHVMSVAGYYNIGWTYTPSEFGCGISAGSWSGWRESERWFRLVVPTHPSDMAGIKVTVTLTGSAPGSKVMVRSSAPSVGRSGTVVATIAPGTSTVLIPGGSIPAAGGELWVGFGPSWQADYVMDAFKPLGYPVACDVGWAPPAGLGNGKLTVTAFGDATWATYADPGTSLGNLAEHDDEDDPWAGGNDVIHVSQEGTPTSSIGGGAFTLTGPGGRCIGAVGDTEDEEQPRGPWSDPWGTTIPFEVDTLSGDGRITFTTTRAGVVTTGTIHLGTTPGISVATPQGSDFEPVTITTGERWLARFDDRSGWFRGKVWPAAAGEPADWLVEVPIPEDTEDIGDRIVLCLYADTGQTVTAYAPSAVVSAPGSWIIERLGVMSGSSDRVQTSHPFEAGTIQLFLSGVFAPPFREDPDAGIAWLDYKPTAGMTVWARYLAA